MGVDIRCLVCEEPVTVLDLCEACIRYEKGSVRERNTIPAPRPEQRKETRSRLTSKLFDPSPCMRGHQMAWKGTRWRCDKCEAMYTHRKRENRRMRTTAAP
jgi:hypothetical protein